MANHISSTEKKKKQKKHSILNKSNFMLLILTTWKHITTGCVVEVFFYNFLSILYVRVFCLHVCLRMSADRWMLEIQSPSSRRVVGALNCFSLYWGFWSMPILHRLFLWPCWESNLGFLFVSFYFLAVHSLKHNSLSVLQSVHMQKRW